MRRYMDEIEVEETVYWLNPSADDFILDLGCGSGRQLSSIDDKSKIIGVDRSIGMLQRTSNPSANHSQCRVLKSVWFLSLG